VRADGVSAYQLLADSTDRTRVTVEGRASSSAGDEFARVNRVGGDFFGAMGIPIRAGRALGPQDDVGTPPTTVITGLRAIRFPGRPRSARGALGVVSGGRHEDRRSPRSPAAGDVRPAFQQRGILPAGSGGSPGTLPLVIGRLSGPSFRTPRRNFPQCAAVPDW
jgi:hypothetical protein